MAKAIKNGIAALCLCILLVLICYKWVDKPLAFWIENQHLPQFTFFMWLTYIPEVFLILFWVILPVLGVRFYYKKWTKTDRVFLAAAVSLTITYILRNLLKPTFGRYWPKTWTHGNPSLLQNNAYGFNWFHHGIFYASFPSGHMALTTAVMMVIGIAYPRWRWLALSVVALVAIGLLGLDYHFLGDVIAGGFLGGIVAYYTAKTLHISAKNTVAE